MGSTATIEKATASKSGRMNGKEFEETFKPKKSDNLTDAGSGEEKAQKGKKNKKDSGEKEKKKKPVLRAIIIISMVLMLIIASLVALYVSGNFSSIFDKAISAVGLTDVLKSGDSESSSIREQQAALEQRTADLDAREEELNALQEKLDKQTAELDGTLTETATTSESFEDIRAGFSEEKLTELKQVGVIYSKMDAAAAAEIMTRIYDTQQLAVIIYYMQPAASAALLAELDAGLAADVTQMLMN